MHTQPLTRSQLSGYRGRDEAKAVFPARRALGRKIGRPCDSIRARCRPTAAEQQAVAVRVVWAALNFARMDLRLLFCRLGSPIRLRLPQILILRLHVRLRQRQRLRQRLRLPLSLR